MNALPAQEGDGGRAEASPASVNPEGGLPVSPGLRRCRPVLLMRSLGISARLYGGPGARTVQGVATCGPSGLSGLADDACAGLDRKEGE